MVYDDVDDQRDGGMSSQKKKECMECTGWALPLGFIAAILSENDDQ